MLSSKQRAYLKSLAHSMQPIFQIGKNEISEAMVKQVSDALNARELIKVHVLETAPYTAREAAEILADETGADVVLVIGTKFILYRETEDEKYQSKKIVLPR